MLSAQTKGTTVEGGADQVGLHLSEHQLDDMNEMQVGQLYELFQETKKPSQFLQKDDTWGFCMQM